MAMRRWVARTIGNMGLRSSWPAVAMNWSRASTAWRKASISRSRSRILSPSLEEGAAISASDRDRRVCRLGQSGPGNRRRNDRSAGRSVAATVRTIPAGASGDAVTSQLPISMKTKASAPLALKLIESPDRQSHAKRRSAHTRYIPSNAAALTATPGSFFWTHRLSTASSRCAAPARPPSPRMGTVSFISPTTVGCLRSGRSTSVAARGGSSLSTTSRSLFSPALPWATRSPTARMSAATSGSSSGCCPRRARPGSSPRVRMRSIAGAPSLPTAPASPTPPMRATASISISISATSPEAPKDGSPRSRACRPSAAGARMGAPSCSARTAAISTMSCASSRWRADRCARCRWRKDGSGFYGLTELGGEHLGIVVYDRATDGFAPVFMAEGADIDGLALAPDGTLLAATRNRAGWSELLLVSTAGGDARPVASLPRGVIADLAWSPDSRRLAFSLTAPTRPRSLWLFDRATATARDLLPEIAANAGAGLDLVDWRLDEFSSFDDRRIPTFTAGPGGKPPPGGRKAVIWVHGGPESQTRPVFRPDIQALVAAGHAVMLPNLRGSTGYGRSYAALDDGPRRPDAVEDLRQARLWFGAQPDIDAARVAAMGQSYGGFMVLATLASHPELWKAAVEHYGNDEAPT